MSTRGNRISFRFVFLVLGLIGYLLLLQPPGWGGEDTASPSATSLAVSSSIRHPIVGERLNFHGRWLAIPVGFGWIEVKDVVEIEGRQAYHIEAQGHSNDVLSTFYPIHDVVHSYLDVQTLEPLRFEKQQHEGHYRSEEVVTFNPDTHVATYRSLLNGSVKEIPLPPTFQDLISALYWFRAQPIQGPVMLTLDLYTDEKIYQTELSVSSPVQFELLKRGTFSCLVVEPKASFKGLLVKRGRIWAYLTDDALRLPLMVRATTPWGPMSAVLDESSLHTYSTSP